MVDALNFVPLQIIRFLCAIQTLEHHIVKEQPILPEAQNEMDLSALTGFCTVAKFGSKGCRQAMSAQLCF